MKVDLSEDRYDRQRLITWWDQDRLHKSRVLVVGAGAIGNEVIKNLALLGVGQIEIVDLDQIEFSNLARCILFRAEDTGKSKAVVAAAAAQRINPDISATGHMANVMLVGLGWLCGFDVIIGGLDNRETRRWVNQAARKIGKTWIDGAIEGLAGVVRMFGPSGVCYECTLGEADYALLAHRKSCALLSRDEMASGKTPTTATTASLVAAIQVQEAVKLIHGREDLLALAGRGFVFQGDSMDSYIVEYSEDPDCSAHDSYDQLAQLVVDSTSTMEDLARGLTQSETSAVCELEDEIVLRGSCLKCAFTKDIRGRLVALPRGSGECPKCSDALQLEVRQMAQAGDELWSIPLVELGYGDQDVVTVRRGSERLHFVLEVKS